MEEKALRKRAQSRLPSLSQKTLRARRKWWDCFFPNFLEEVWSTHFVICLKLIFQICFNATPVEMNNFIQTLRLALKKMSLSAFINPLPLTHNRRSLFEELWLRWKQSGTRPEDNWKNNTGFTWQPGTRLQWPSDLSSSTKAIKLITTSTITLTVTTITSILVRKSSYYFDCVKMKILVFCCFFTFFFFFYYISWLQVL